MTEHSGEPPSGGGPPRPPIGEEDYERLHRELVVHFRRQRLSPEKARELTQETLLQIVRNQDTFEGRSQLKTWAIAIAKNVWLRHERDRRRLKRAAEEVPLEAETIEDRPARELAVAPESESPERRAIERDLLRRVKETLGELPEQRRNALLFNAGGHKYREIAALMNVPVDRVSSLIHEARKKLRREFADARADRSP